MASRSLARLATPASRVLRPSPISAASLSTSAPSASSLSKLTSKNALISTPMARVSRTAPRFLVGEGGRREASTEEGGGSMVSQTSQQTIWGPDMSRNWKADEGVDCS